MKLSLKLSVHQYIALNWTVWSLVIFTPVLESSNRADAGAVLAWGVVIVAFMIVATPAVLRAFPPLRRLYWWVDAMSEQQRQALRHRQLRRFYQVAFSDGYVSRLRPYVVRIFWTVGLLLAITNLIPSYSGQPFIDALKIFTLLYPLGVLILVLLSLPLGAIFAAANARNDR